MKMKLKIYSIYDSTAQAFGNPFYMHNDGMAIRAFQDMINSDKKENMVAAHPEQFTLFQVGTWDDKNAAIDTAEPKSIAIGVELINPENKTFTLDDLKALFKENNVIPMEAHK
jgi:hypothetical protein